MKGYDSLLFRALIGANQLEFKENMDSAESAEYSYSPRYNRFRRAISAWVAVKSVLWRSIQMGKKEKETDVAENHNKCCLYHSSMQHCIGRLDGCKSDGPGSSIELASGYKRK